MKGQLVRSTLAALAIAGMLSVVGCTQQKDSGRTGSSTQNKATQNKGGEQQKQNKAAQTKSEQKKAEPAPAKAAEPAAAKPAEPAKPVAAAAPAKPATETAPAASGSGSGASYRPAVDASQSYVNQAFPTGDARTSAVLLTTVMPRQVRVGQPYEFQYHVTNLTNNSLSNVIVTNENTSNTSIASSAPAATRNTAGALQWVIPTLAAGKTEIIRVSGSAGQVGSSGNCATVTYASSLCATTNVIQPAIAITKAITPAEGTPCDTYTMLVTVTNTGKGAVEGVKVSDTLPAGMTGGSGQTAFNWDAGTLAEGAKKEFRETLKIGKSGRYENAATTTAAGGLTAESNKVAVVVKTPVLAITSNCTPAQLRAGQSGKCCFTVSNTGDGVAPNVQVVGSASNATFVSADNGGTANAGKVTWNLGNINPGESKTICMTSKASGIGSLACNATASTACAQPVSANCSIPVIGVPDIGTGIEDFSGVRTVGEDHEFTYIVKNQGQVDLTNVVMVGDFDEGLDYLSTNFAGGATKDGQKVTWKIGTLPVGKSVTFKFTSKCAAAGAKVVRTITKSDQTREVRNDEQVNIVEP